MDLINGFKNYFKSHNQTIYENPSPGNKKGGISTLEDKSLGCTQKSGSAPVVGVLSYGERVKKPGLNLLSAPGNALVASTALAASGAHIVLFTTGRGTPFACPVPTMKIASNSVLAGKKKNWIDFNCGALTEAGIVYDAACRLEDAPPSSYPAKLTQFLYRRFQRFGGEAGKGFVILACELIEDNGKELKRCVLRYAEQWGLDANFMDWVQKENLFCSTLVDRIVTGYPRAEADRLNEENGYTDQLLDTGEVFGFWVIEGPQSLKEELPFDKADLPVLITGDHKPYKQRKVRILNGAHTAMVLGAYLAGQDIVRDCMDDGVICGFMNKAVYEEIIPTLTLPEEELKDFAHSVTERFKNPFIDHALLSISLNSTSKWRARVMPSLLEYAEKKQALPPCLTASFAFYIAFYRGKRLEDAGLVGARNGTEYMIQDDRKVLEFYFDHRDCSNQELAHAVMTNAEFWGQDLTQISGLEQAVTDCLDAIDRDGAYQVMKSLC